MKLETAFVFLMSYSEAFKDCIVIVNGIRFERERGHER